MSSLASGVAAAAYNRRLIEASLDPLVTISPEGKITDVNRATEEVTGCPREQLIGTDFSDYCTDPESARRVYQQVFREGQVKDFALELRSPDGRVTPVLYNASLYRDEAGQVAGVFAAARDVSEKRQAQAAVQQAAAYNRSLIEASLDPLVTISPEGKITDVNRATEEVTGCPREQLIGTDFSDYFTDPESARRGYRQVFREGLVKDYELEIRARDGRVSPVLYNASLYRDEAGEVAGIFAAARDISEKKQAQAALQRAAAYNRSLIEASLDPLVTISPEGKITDVNRATEEVTGCTREQLIGTDFSDYFTDPESARRGYQQVFREGQVKDYELEIRSRDGRITPVLYHASLYRDAAGQVAGVFAAARDVSERKRAETLRAYLASIVDSAGTTVIGKDLEGVILSWNGGAEVEYGYTAAEMIGRSIMVLVPDDRTAEALDILQRVRSGESIVRHETVRVHKDGRRVDVELAASPIRDAQGRVIGVSTIAHDIRARKQAELELRLSRERLALALQAGLSGTFEWDIRNNVNTWSPEIEALYGIAAGTFGGRYEDWETLVLPEDLEHARSTLQGSLQTGEFASEWRVRRPDNGAVRWLAARAKVFFDESGAPERMIGINSDITDRKRAEEALEKKAQELARSNADLEQFAYVASHDLQEPLRMVANFTQLVAERYGDRVGPEGREFMAYAVDGATRMKSLIEDLLAYSRVGTRGQPFQPVECSAALEYALTNLQAAIRESGATVSYDTLPTVSADATQLTQVFQNLIGNAIKFHGAEPPRVHVSAERLNSEWRLAVRDNGIGINPRFSERIFVIFQRLHGHGAYPGTGIGLAVCKRIVDRHGGRIWVESQPGSGSTFYFTIPAV